MSNILNNLLVSLKGFAMGAANVIPGVSGGTIALLTGIFNELVESINSVLSVSSWKLAFQGKFKEFWKTIHGDFLLWLAIGILVSVFTLAKLMEYSLQYHPIQTWSFFFGLILVSAFFLLAELPKQDAASAGNRANEGRTKDILWLLAGIVIGIVICKLSPTTTPDTWWFVLICGAIAICAMILPGISGSFLLVLLGKYEYIMAAISGFDWPTLIVFCIGCLIGIAAFSKFLGWLIARYERTTLLVLIGFTLGSLIKVWPWSDKVSIATAQLMRSGQSAEEASQGVQLLVDSGLDLGILIEPQIASAVCWMITGAALVIALEWVSKANAKIDAQEKKDSK